MLDFHDQTSHFISDLQIKEMLYAKASILKQAERELLRDEIARARVDGKLSPYKLHHVLKSLRAQNKISRYDQEAAEEVFEEFLNRG